jgi:hypothetical protein
MSIGFNEYRRRAKARRVHFIRAGVAAMWSRLRGSRGWSAALIQRKA